ncbi:MAG TPA: 2-oxoacid:ferredoxin oxidoreductase subunit beta [bacterium]|jgi:2-oxoglutarate ferredoxin oxidoreductase subunit beta
MSQPVINRLSETEQQYTVKDFKSDLKPVWCSGCGDFGILTALVQSFAKLGIPRDEIATITGIGCSSRLPGYLSTYGFNSLHGRAVPIAGGVKLANPNTMVIASGGDGDGFSIGAGHLPHAVRRNIDITYIVMDNFVYGLTKGQASPTTPLDDKTASTTYGSIEPPLNMCGFVHAYNCGFIARTHSGDIKQMVSVFMEGLQYPGFAFIQVFSPCVTFRGNGEYAAVKQMVGQLPEDYDNSNREAAWKIIESKDPYYTGVIYRNDNLPSFHDRINGMREKAKAKGTKSVDELFAIFRP